MPAGGRPAKAAAALAINRPRRRAASVTGGRRPRPRCAGALAPWPHLAGSAGPRPRMAAATRARLAARTGRRVLGEDRWRPGAWQAPPLGHAGVGAQGLGVPGGGSSRSLQDVDRGWGSSTAGPKFDHPAFGANKGAQGSSLEHSLCFWLRLRPRTRFSSVPARSGGSRRDLGSTSCRELPPDTPNASVRRKVQPLPPRARGSLARAGPLSPELRAPLARLDARPLMGLGDHVENRVPQAHQRYIELGERHIHEQ